MVYSFLSGRVTPLTHFVASSVAVGSKAAPFANRGKPNTEKRASIWGFRLKNMVYNILRDSQHVPTGLYLVSSLSVFWRSPSFVRSKKLHRD